jgi:hypothetical protein
MKTIRNLLAGAAFLAAIGAAQALADVTVLGWPGGPEEAALRKAAEAYNATAADRRGQADLLQPQRLLRQARRRSRRGLEGFRRQSSRDLRHRPLRAFHGPDHAAGFGERRVRREGAGDDAIWRQAIWRADRSVASLHVLPHGSARQAACRCGLEGALRGDQRKTARQETRSQGPRPMDLGRLGGDRPVFHEGDQSRQPDALRNRAADEEPPVQHDGLAFDRAVRGRRLDGRQRQDHGELAGLPVGARAL